MENEDKALDSVDVEDASITPASSALIPISDSLISTSPVDIDDSVSSNSNLVEKPTEKQVITREPWDRQENEPWKDFDLFIKYKELDPIDRSINTMSKLTGKSTTSIRRIANKNKWDERISYWYIELDRRELIRRATQRKEMEVRYTTLCKTMTDKAMERLSNMNPESLSNNELAKWVEMAAKIESQMCPAPVIPKEPKEKLNVQINNVPAIPKNEVNVSIQQNTQNVQLPNTKQIDREVIDVKMIDNKSNIIDAEISEKQSEIIEKIKIEPKNIVLDKESSDLACKLLEQIYKTSNPK